MGTDAVVREWHTDEGWGVLDSAGTPGGCWAHFSAAAVSGYADFAAGQAVRLEWEAPGQDGFPFRATRFWPAGTDPVDRESGPAGGYTSTLRLNFDV